MILLKIAKRLTLANPPLFAYSFRKRVSLQTQPHPPLNINK